MLFNLLTDLMSLQRSQWFNRRKLAQIQAKKLASIVEHAYNNISFYREFYRSVAFNNLLTIENLPYLTKDMARKTPLERLVFGGSITERHEVFHTSGSSGQPLKVVINDREAGYSEAVKIRSIIAQGAKLLDEIYIIRPVSAEPEGKVYRLTEKKRFYGFLRTSKARPLPSSFNIASHVELMKKRRPQMLIAFPSYLIQLADYCKKNDVSLSFKIIRTTGELLTQQARETIEKSFQARVFDSYGAEEIGNIAWECPTGEGYHVNAEALYLEVLRDGFPVSSGEEGEVCVTTLYRYSQPFIRYLLGDIVTLVADECSCGRGLPLIRKIHGRTVDVIVRKDGLPIFPLTILNTLHDVEGLDMFRVVQRNDYVVEVLIKPFDGAERSVEAAVEQKCRLLFPDTPFVVKVVDRFDLDKVKFRPVVSHVKTSQS
ncbi:MAG: hypothetical protein RMK31_03880 [Candidatus Caldarchaeum sp.]|nr:hypothetical protein [Candidatus Caldarchaeum sp.]